MNSQDFSAGQFDSLVKDSLVKEAKWRIYCHHCMDTIKWFRESNIDTILTLGSAELQLDTIKGLGDSVLIEFTFRSIAPIANSCLTNGIVFAKQPNRVKYAMTSCNFSFDVDVNPSGRDFVGPIRPQLVEFIKQNANKLDPWFQNEAINRKIL
jgi:hypothetical protein